MVINSQRRTALGVSVVGAVGAQVAVALVVASTVEHPSLRTQVRTLFALALLVVSVSLFWSGIGLRFHQAWARQSIVGLLKGAQAVLAGAALLHITAAFIPLPLGQSNVTFLPVLLLGAGQGLSAVLLRPAIRYFVTGSMEHRSAAA